MKKRLLRVLLLLLVSILAVMYLIKRPVWVSNSNTAVKSQINQQLLQQHVKQLSDEIKARSYDMGEGLNLASDYIESQMKLNHDQVTIQAYQANGTTFQNIIATHGPKDAPMLIIGAHYDAYGGMPGADDNASGVAGLLELNRLLAAEKLTKQVVLVAYTLEEPPLYASQGMGSVIHAKSVKDEDIELMISLEMIGYFNDQPDSQNYPASVLGWVYPDTGHFITVVDELFSTAGPKLKKTFNQQGLIEAYSINAPAAIPGIDFSDHRSYWAHGIPAIMVTDTAFYRNHNYHEPTDTYDTLDYQKMSYVVSGVLAHIKQLAQ